MLHHFLAYARVRRDQVGAGRMNALDDFDVVIRRKTTRIVAAVPELGLYATGADIPAALEALESRKAALVNDLAAAEVSIEKLKRSPGASASSTAASGISLARDVGRFTIKVMIVIALLGAGMIVTFNSVAARIDAQLYHVGGKLRELRAAGIGVSELLARAEATLGRAADPQSEMSEARKQKLTADIRTVVARWRPIISEFAPLVAALQDTGPQGGKSPDAR
jgi:hypothetical protein